MSVLDWAQRYSAQTLAMLRAQCPWCARVAATRVIHSRRYFTLFFVPVFPTSSRYLAQCTFCGRLTQIQKEVADGMVAASEQPSAVPGA